VLRIKNPLIEIKNPMLRALKFWALGKRSLPYANGTYLMLMKYCLEQGIWKKYGLLVFHECDPTFTNAPLKK
jgi:hypothetical protein